MKPNNHLLPPGRARLAGWRWLAVAALLAPLGAAAAEPGPCAAISINGEAPAPLAAGTPAVAVCYFWAPQAGTGAPGRFTLGSDKAEAWSDLVVFEFLDAQGKPLPSAWKLVERAKEKTLVLEGLEAEASLTWQLSSEESRKLAPGEYHVRVRAAGGVAADADLTVVADAGEPAPEANLRRWRAEVGHGLATGDLKEARRAVWNWLKSRPDDVEGLAAYALVLERPGRTELAYAIACRAIKLAVGPGQAPASPSKAGDPAAPARLASAHGAPPGSLLALKRRLQRKCFGLDKFDAESRAAPEVLAPGLSGGQESATDKPLDPATKAALDEYNGWVQKGDNLAAEGDYFEAVRVYERAGRVAYNNKLKVDSAALAERLAEARKRRDEKKTP